MRAAVGAGAAAAAAAPPACGTPSASGTATSHPEREQEEEGLVPPVTATLPAGSCAAAMQLCLQCRVAPSGKMVGRAPAGVSARARCARPALCARAAAAALP